MDELYYRGMCILKDANRHLEYFVNQMQFTKHALDFLGSTAFFNFSDGIFDGIKPPHVLSMGKKHILWTTCFLWASDE